MAAARLATSLIMVVTATGAALLGARSAALTREHVGADAAAMPVTMSTSNALLFPVVASVGLLVLYLLFNYIALLVLLYMCFVGVVSTGAFAHTVLQLLPRLVPPRLRLRASAAFAIATVAAWVWTGHWLPNDVIGVSLSVFLIYFLRVPSLKLCTACMALLIVYDVFWVFFSKPLFGDNVMVAVATQQANNPAAKVAAHLPIPARMQPVGTLEMPNKLLFPVYGHDADEGVASSPAMHIIGFMMLGLGDIALPGLLMNYAQRCDMALEMVAPALFASRRSYLCLTSVGYVIGLCAALAISRATQSAQPALLYLIPATLVAIIGGAWWRGELRVMWSGALAARSGGGGGGGGATEAGEGGASEVLLGAATSTAARDDAPPGGGGSGPVDIELGGGGPAKGE